MLDSADGTAGSPPVGDPSPTKVGASKREALLHRIDALRSQNVGNGPLTWDDIGFFVQGLAFATRPLSKATAGLTQRYGLGPRGAWMLNLIAADIAYPHELADVLGIGRSLVSSELTRLTQAGLIDSKPGADRRRTKLALTEDGRAALAEVRTGLDAVVRNGLAGYSAADVRLCARLLCDLRNSVSDAPHAD